MGGRGHLLKKESPMTTDCVAGKEGREEKSGERDFLVPRKFQKHLSESRLLTLSVKALSAAAAEHQRQEGRLLGLGI